MNVLIHFGADHDHTDTQSEADIVRQKTMTAWDVSLVDHGIVQTYFTSGTFTHSSVY